MTPDLNVLIAASRSDHPQHEPARIWMDQAVEDCGAGGSIELLPMVSAGFLRIVTNPKVFINPTPILAAVEFVDSLLAVPGVEMPELGREWRTLSQMSIEHGLRANDITDAWIAAAVRTLGGHLVTFDGGFRRLLGRGELTVLKPS